MSDIYQQFRKIKAIAMDVDGVLTNGKLLCTENGEWLRQFDIKDGYAIHHATKHGFHIAVISGSDGEGVKARMQRLGVEKVFQKSEDKIQTLNEWLHTINVKHDETIFIGDDVPDIGVLKSVGLPCCPKDAVMEVLEVCKYISPYNGGESCVRDIIEKVMKLQGSWNAK